MATKSKAKSRSRSSKRNADAERASADRGTQAFQRQIREREGDAAAETQRQAQAERDSAIKENDQVVVDIEAVPDAIKNSALASHLNSLTGLGAHGKAGRVARVEQTSDGVFYHVEGPDFAHRVPAAAVRRADEAQKARKGSAAKKKTAKKKSAKKK
jgi:hypothetical protein